MKEEKLFIKSIPDLVEEWHPSKNSHLDMNTITYASNKEVWWKCKNERCGYEWKTMVWRRTVHYKDTGEITKCDKCQHRPPYEESFASLYPEKVKEWHPTKNGQNLPSDYKPKSKHKAIWLCLFCNESYPMTIQNKANGQNCPYCTGKRVGKLNNLKVMYPDIAKDWHPSKNKKSPSEVYGGGDTKHYWICKKCNETYQASVYDRIISKQNRCPYCSGKKVGKYNNLEYLFPEIAKEWHPTKNNLKPSQVMAYSGKYAYWQCPINHEHVYKAMIGNRTGLNSGCPHCYKIHTSYWELRILDALKKRFPTILHRHTPIQKSRKELDIYIPDLKIGIEVDGGNYHQNFEKDKEKNSLYMKNGITIIRVRAIGLKPIEPCINNIHPQQPVIEYINDLIRLISKISNQHFAPITIELTKTNQELYSTYLESKSLSFKYPEIAKEYDIDKNEIPPELITYGSNQIVYWKGLNCGHEWDATVITRTLQGDGCPYCSGKRVNKDNCLATLYPEVSAYWDFTRNEKTPNDITAHSKEGFYWLCTKYKNKSCPKRIPVFSRVNRNGCIECFKGSGVHMKGKKYPIPYEESLEFIYPEIAKLWDFEKNKFSPKEYKPISSYSVAWICPCCKKSHPAEIRYKVFKSSTKFCKSCASKSTKSKNPNP